MKFNIANPSTGLQKVVTVEDEKQLRVFMEKRMNQEVEGEALGPEWKGYVLKISGGNDKQGFPMMQGVMVNHRVRLLLRKGSKCYRPRKAEQELPGLTDEVKPRRLAPKRATRIRKLFNLGKKDDVRKYVVRREFKSEGGKTYKKAGKIQRLITPQRLQRKRAAKAIKKARGAAARDEAARYEQLKAQRNKEARLQRAEARSASRRSVSKA